MPSLTLDISPKSDLSRRILDGVRGRVQASKRKYQDRHQKWKEAEDKMLAFLPERDIDAARRVNRDQGGKPTYTTIQIPYSYAVLMTSHTYWTTVFMSRSPVLQFTGRHGESQQKVQALEALMDYQVQVGEMLVPWYIWLHDVGKYGAGVLGLYWDERFSMISEIVEEEELMLGAIPTGRMKKIRQTKRVTGYVGNTVYNIRPYDFLPDARVPLHRFQQGEYCAVYNEIGWNTILKRKELGLYTNIDFARRFSRKTSQRQESGSQLVLPDSDLFANFEFDDTSKAPRGADILPIYECVIELVPDLWGLGKSKLPEKWVFTVTVGFEVVIGAQPLGALHDKFPYVVMELEPEGYALTSRGIPEILEPIENTANWLLNSHFYNVRKTLNDQFIGDPSRMVMKDFKSDEPGRMIRLKPSAYGTDVRTVLQQLPVTDVTRSHVVDMDKMFEIGSRVSGVSDSLMGVLNQKGRKTATEVRTSSTFGINRLKTTSEFFSAMGFSPMSQMMVQNSQQYYDAEMKFRIVGDLAEEAGPNFVEVNADMLQGFYDFVPVDGTLPIDRFAQANLWRELLGQLQKFPEIMAQYDMGRIFAWVAQLAGLKNINQFKVQVKPDEQLAAQAQAGNVVGLSGSSSGPDLTGVSEPGQISGLGATG